MDEIKQDLNKLRENVIQSDEDEIDVKADENAYLDSVEDFEDMDVVINWYLFYWF